MSDDVAMFYFTEKKNKINEFVYLSLEHIDQICLFSLPIFMSNYFRLL